MSALCRLLMVKVKLKNKACVPVGIGEAFLSTVDIGEAFRSTHKHALQNLTKMSKSASVFVILYIENYTWVVFFFYFCLGKTG